MGQDKALLSSGPKLLVTAVAQQVADAAGSVALVGGRDRYLYLGFDCLEDQRANLGPLAGIEAALASRRGELNLIIACDMPGLSGTLLRTLLGRAHEVDSLCVAARDASGITHPLCAVYRSGCLPVVRKALDDGRLKLMNLLEELGAESIETGGTIWNVNTPQEWNAWRERAPLG